MADRLDLQLISGALRRLGWVRFWAQLVLAVVVLGVLMFNNIGGRLAANSSRALGLGPGISLTTLAFLLLLWCIWQSWLVVRCGRALASPVHPSKGETARLIKRGVLADLVGITLAVVGYQSLAGSLFVQASQQVPGFFGFEFKAMESQSGVVVRPGVTLLFVTLDKAAMEAAHRYEDAFLTAEEFRWQSQNRTRGWNARSRI